MNSHTKYFNEQVGESTFSEFVSLELEHIPIPESPGDPQSIFVCGRYGAGKSTFTDNWMGHPDFFPNSVYHIDSDRIMKDMFEMGLTKSRADTSAFQAVQARLLECLSLLGATFSYSFAGKENLGPVSYRLPKTYPGYSSLKDDEKIIAKPCGHMVLCDQDVALARVRQRQADGGHPYQKLEGDFEEKYRRKQAQIIYGLPLYADGVSGKYHIWDASMAGAMSLVATIEKGQEGRVITIHDDVSAAKFGLHEAPLKSLFTLHDQYDFVYNSIVGRIIDGQYLDEDVSRILSETSDRLDVNLMNEILRVDPQKQAILKRSLRHPGDIEIKNGDDLIINPFERKSPLPPQPFHPIGRQAPQTINPPTPV